jgi:antitoxin component HigA of HigAB toxin-antitoxin module
VIRRKRRLSLDMIQKLSTTWKIPADALVKPYKIAGEDEAA